MKKQRLSILLAALLLLSLLGGCASSSSSGAAASQPAAASGTEAASGSTAAPSGEAIVLNFPSIWVGSDSKAAVFGKMVTDFNAEYAGKYEIKIEEQTDYDAYRDKIRTQISTGAAPDIFTLDNMADMELFASSGKLMDLTEFLADPAMHDKFSKDTIENAQIEGVNYAFPYEMAVIPIMMNDRLLKDAGVETPPTSYDELWAACEKLKAAGVFPTTQMTNDNAWTSMLWYSYALASVGGETVYDNGLDDPAFVTAAEIMQKMFENTSSDAVGADASVVNGHFFNERAALYANGTWVLGRIKSEGVEGLYDNLVVSPALSYDGKNGGAYVTSIQAYIAAGKQDDPAKEEAVKAFFQFITEADRVVELANSSGALFAVEIDSTKIEDPMQALIVKQNTEAPFTIGHFQAKMPTPVATAFPSALEALVLGDVTPEEFVQQLKDANV